MTKLFYFLFLFFILITLNSTPPLKAPHPLSRSYVNKNPEIPPRPPAPHPIFEEQMLEYIRNLKNDPNQFLNFIYDLTRHNQLDYTEIAQIIYMLLLNKINPYTLEQSLRDKIIIKAANSKNYTFEQKQILNDLAIRISYLARFYSYQYEHEPFRLENYLGELLKELNLHYAKIQKLCKNK